MRAPKARLILLLLVACVQSAAFAHGLLARVRAEGGTLVGAAYYSSGEVARGEWVEIFDVTAANTKVAEFATDANGIFRYIGTAGHRYRIAVHGEEGHGIELEISLASGSRASLVESDTAAGASSGIPAWAVVGGALLLVTLLGVPFQLRRRRPPEAWRST